MKYLDTNVLGYAIENHVKYGPACKKILIDVQAKKLPVAASLIVLIELVGVLKKINKELLRKGQKPLDIKENIDAVLSLPIVWVELEVFLIKHAAGYPYAIPGADCLHVATMEVNGIYEILSADGDFDKVSFIKRIDPLEYK